jgi:hypothetical protein
VACSRVNFTLLESVDLRVPIRNFRGFSLLNVDFKSRNSPSARCASAASAIGSDTDIFIGCSVSVIKMLLNLHVNEREI